MIVYICDECNKPIKANEVYRVQINEPDQQTKHCYHFHLNCLPFTEDDKFTSGLVKPKSYKETDIFEEKSKRRGRRGLNNYEKARIIAAYIVYGKNVKTVATSLKFAIQTVYTYVNKLYSGDLELKWIDHPFIEFPNNRVKAQDFFNLFANGWSYELLEEEFKVSSDEMKKAITYYTGVLVE